MAYDNITAGETVHFYVAVSNADGVKTNPTGIEFHLKRPDAVIQTYTYGTDLNLTKDSTGKYSIDLTLNLPGTYYYKWKTASPNISIVEGEVIVVSSLF